MTLYEWFTILQTAVMVVASVILWSLRASRQAAVDDAAVVRRLDVLEKEFERYRDWRHNEVIPWQQRLVNELEHRFVTRREYDAARTDDSPYPQNRRMRERKP